MKRPLTTETTDNQVAAQPGTALTESPAVPPLNPLPINTAPGEKNISSLVGSLIKKPILSFGIGIGIGLATVLMQLFSGHSNSSNLVSRVDYERIQPGMTQTQVEATLPLGIEVSRSEESTQLVWENPDGSKVEAEFQNRILTSKAQSGLK